MQVTCGNSSFKLVGLPLSDFPQFPAVPEPVVKFDASLLANLVQKTAFAVSEQESRYVLNAALLKLKSDGATMVATDGHRLALVERKAQIPDLKDELSLLIPRKTLAVLARLAESDNDEATIEISKDRSQVYFALGSHILASRLVTGQFPNYEAVLPKEQAEAEESCFGN